MKDTSRVVSLDTGHGIVSVDWPPPAWVVPLLRRMLVGNPPRPGQDPSLERDLRRFMVWLDEQERKHPTHLSHRDP